MAYGVNDAGQIVGQFIDGAGVYHGFLYSGGTYTTIDDPLGLMGTEPFGINDQGQIVGGYQDSSGVTHGFIAVLPILFTAGADSVDFNNLTPAQIAAINAGADLYNSQGGNDNVILPDPARYQLTPSVAWDPTHIFPMGDGNDSVTGGDGNYILALGSGADTVKLGNGNNKVTAGGGNDSVAVGTGKNTLDGGTGTSTVVFGNVYGSTKQFDCSPDFFGPCESDAVTQPDSGRIHLSRIAYLYPVSDQ
jgi:probable HAF family extracellular repeat protein